MKTSIIWERFLIMCLLIALIAGCKTPTPTPSPEPTATSVPPTPSPRTERQEEQLINLRRLSTKEQFRAVVKNGQVIALLLDYKLETRPEDSDSVVDNSVSSFIQGQTELLRIHESQGELRLTRRAGDELRVYHYQQFVDNIPVYGSNIKVVVNRQEETAEVKAIFGSYIPDLEAQRFGIPELTEPYTRVSFTHALEIIRKNQGGDNSEFKVYESEGLTIYDEAIFQPRCPNCQPIMHDPRLCWHLIFSTNRYNGAIVDAFVDATDGEIVHIQPRVYQSRDINVYDNSNQNVQLYDNSLTCLVAPCPVEATTVFTATEIVYDYFKDVHDWDSYDGRGTQIEAYVRVPTYNGLSFACNALYHHTDFGLDRFEFGDGSPSLECVAHEYTHGVHKKATGYVYQNESGAITEHIADAYAIMISHWSGLQTNDWTYSSGCSPVRSFDAVPADRDQYHDYLPLPMNVDPQFTNDYGFVHRNCQILNNAFFMMAHGDTFTTTFTGPVTVQPVDEDKLAEIYLVHVGGNVQPVRGMV